MKTHRSIAASLLAAVVLSPAAGSAAPPAPLQAASPAPPQTIPSAPPPTTSPAPPQADALSRTARELFAKGEEAWMQGKYDQCHAWFLAAWSLRPHRQIAGNLAACAVKVGRYRDAAEHLAFLMKETPDGKLTPAQRALFDEALKHIAVVQVDAKPGATVLVDGEVVGKAPLPAPLYLEPGEHTLEARSRAGAVAEQATQLDAGTQREVSLHPPVPEATSAPPPAEPVPRPVAPPPPPPPDTPVRDGVVIGGLALGGAAIATSVVLVLVSSSKSEEVNDATRSIAMDGGANACNDPSFSRARCDALADAYIAEGTTRNLALTALVTAGAALGGAALTYALWPVDTPRAPASRGVRIAPAVTAQSAGLTIGGAF